MSYKDDRSVGQMFPLSNHSIIPELQMECKHCAIVSLGAEFINI